MEHVLLVQLQIVNIVMPTINMFAHNVMLDILLTLQIQLAVGHAQVLSAILALAPHATDVLVATH